MVYIDETGTEHALPKLTLGLQRKIDKADAATGEDAYRAMYDVVRECLPEHAELLDGKTIDTVDLVALQRVYAGVHAAYAAPAAESRRKGIEDALAALDGEALGRLTEFADAVGKVDGLNRKGFALVR